MALQFNPLLTAVFQNGVPVSKNEVSQLFGQVREFVNGLEVGLQDVGVWTLASVGGNASAFTGTLPFTPDADTVVLLVPPVENSGPVTLTVNGGPVRSIMRADTTNLQAGDLKQGQPVMLRMTAAGDWRVIASGLLWSVVMSAIRGAGVHNIGSVAGTGNAITGTLPFAEVPGETVAIIIPPATNTGPVTLKLGSGPVRSIMANDSTNLSAGDLRAGQGAIIRLSAAGVWRVVGVLRSEIADAVAVEKAAREAADNAIRAAARDGLILPLVNVAGTGDAITADLSSTLIAAGITTLSSLAELDYVPIATNAAVNPTITVAGVTLGIRDAGGGDWPAGGFRVGYIYKLRRRGMTARVSGGVSYREILDLGTRLSGQEARWTDRATNIQAETPVGYTVPAGTSTIVTRGGSYVDYWQKSTQQSNPPADGRVLTANDGYWVRLVRLPKAEMLQPVINAVQEVTGPSHWNFLDSLGRVGGAIDLAGGLHLPDLNGLSVQEHIHRLSARAAVQVETAISQDRVNLVEVYGADPTGVRDIAPLLNQAYLDLAASTTGPKTIYLPRGEYRLNDRVTPRSGVALVGAGMFETTIKPYTFRAAFDWRPFVPEYLENCVFTEFGIDAINQTLQNGGYSVQTKGFFFQRFRRCVFTRLWIRDTGATSIGIDFADDSYIGNNLIQRGGRLAEYGMFGASGIGIGTGKLQSEPLLIVNNIVMDAKNYNIFFERQGQTDFASRHNLVANNICIGGTHSFGDCGVDGTLVTGNQFVGAIQSAVIFHGATVGAAGPSSSSLLTGNYIARAGGAGVEWNGSSWNGRGYVSRGNRIVACAKGHWLRCPNNAPQDDFEIDDSIRDCLGEAVHFESGSFTNVDIKGRMINNTGVAIRLGATMRGGSIEAKMRDLRGTPTQTGSIAGAGLITDFMINGCHGVGCATEALTNPGNVIAWGFNPGVRAS